MKWFKSLVIPCHVKEGSGQRNAMFLLTRENQLLRKQLQRIIDNAIENEAIWRNFLEIERILFRSRQIDQLVETLLYEMKERFEPDLLVLFLSHGELLERFIPDLPDCGQQVVDGAWVVPFSPGVEKWFTEKNPKPICLSDSKRLETMPLPKELIAEIGSAFLVPLSVHESLFGALLIGSRDPYHYNAEDGTDLLEQLGVKIALCMENCLVYERLKELWGCDQTTNLLNFFQIHLVLEREFRRARRKGTPLSLLVADLEFVKKVGEDLEAGDLISHHVSKILTENFPDMNGFAGRYGSYEFLIILPHTTPHKAQDLANQIREIMLLNPLCRDNTVILIRPRIAIASLSNEMSCAQDLLDTAMNQLYRARVTSYASLSSEIPEKPSP